MQTQWRATFDIKMTPADGPFEGACRFDFTKAWSGELTGTGVGVMMSAGDPGAGDAGYVCLERFEGTLGERAGSFVLQQNGAMDGGEPTLDYTIVPGSGTGELADVRGTVELEVVDGVHHVTLRTD